MITINGKNIGPGFPTYVIAELSGNHGQNYDDAVQLIHAAKACGADAVKLQTYTADTLTLPSRAPMFKIEGGTLWDGKTLHELYAEAYTPWDWQPKLQKVAASLDLTLFSTPFDPSSVEFLEAMNVPAYKIASFEIVDIPLIELVGSLRKPMILSTGMATLEEIQEAVAAAKEAGAMEIALLKCTSAYPAPLESMNLRTLADLARRFHLPVGISDHSAGNTAAITAVALGASIVERHLTLSRNHPGPDRAFSIEPSEFKAMVETIRAVEQTLGSVTYGVTPEETKARVFRRSLFVVQDIVEGEMISTKNVRSIRPGDGLSPKFLKEVLGCRSKRNISAGTPLSWEDITR